MKITLSVPEKNKLRALQEAEDGWSGYMSVASPAARNYSVLERLGLVVASVPKEDANIISYTITDKGRRYDNPVPLTAENVTDVRISLRGLFHINSNTEYVLIGIFSNDDYNQDLIVGQYFRTPGYRVNRVINNPVDEVDRYAAFGLNPTIYKIVGDQHELVVTCPINLNGVFDRYVK